MTIIETEEAVPDGDEHLIECPRCQGQHDPDDRHYSPSPSCCEYHATQCDSCLEYELTSCEDCGETVHMDCTASDDYISVCDSCYRRGWSYCERCEQLVRPFLLARNGLCESCDDAYGEPEVNGYCYKPNPIMHGTQGPWFGMEIELEYGDGEAREVCDLAQEAFTTPSAVYLKSDGSLSHGVEIVTHPMSVEWAIRNLNQSAFARMVSLGARSWRTTTCGIHVHAGRGMFPSDSALARFCILIYRSQEAIEKFAGRSGSRWCSFDMDSDESITKQASKKQRPYDRYRAVNLQNEHTVEVRVFRGTLNPEGILGIHQLVAAMAEYSCERRTGMGLSESLTWSAFRRWLHDNNDRFPHATQRVEARVDRRI